MLFQRWPTLFMDRVQFSRSAVSDSLQHARPWSLLKLMSLSIDLLLTYLFASPWIPSMWRHKEPQLHKSWQEVYCFSWEIVGLSPAWGGKFSKDDRVKRSFPVQACKHPPAASLFSPAFRALGSKPGTKVLPGAHWSWAGSPALRLC